ncbi:MAD3 protein, partial [Poecile atricapillus]|nr:MAD3 protein [Poecile atricapillus]
MEPAATSIQVLLQAAEFLEHREHRHPLGLAEAEHGYAALCPAPSRRAGGGGSSILGRCWVATGPPSSRPAHGSPGPQRLEEQELRARRAKDRLRDRQRSLQRRLELLLLPTDGERARADSLDSSQLSEPSEEGKKGERTRVEVDGVMFSEDLLASFGTGRDHSYSSPHSPAS